VHLIFNTGLGTYTSL